MTASSFKSFGSIKVFFTALAVALVSSVNAQDAGIPLKLEKSILLEGVKGRIDHMAIDVQGQRLFVAALGNNTVEVVDLKAGKKIVDLSGFGEPQGIAYVAEFDKLFIANGSDGTCRVLDGCPDRWGAFQSFAFRAHIQLKFVLPFSEHSDLGERILVLLFHFREPFLPRLPFGRHQQGKRSGRRMIDVVASSTALVTAMESISLTETQH
jgi:hypothetical protein